MLCYLGTGLRHYHEKPVPVYRRAYWEFQAVLSGSIAMTVEKGDQPPRSRCLWISAPEHAHGWTARLGKPAEVAVFHFLSIPEPLARVFRQKTCLEIPISPTQQNRIRSLAQSVEASRLNPGPEWLMRHEHLLMELSLIPFENAPVNRHTPGGNERIHTALAWFNKHMQHNPSLAETARAAGASPAHLRRLFHQTMQASPKKIFDQLRFQRVLHLMADPSIKLAEAGTTCGFESPATFSRAFKKKFGCSPVHWRK